MKNRLQMKLFLGSFLSALLLAGPVLAGPGMPEFWNTDKVSLGLTETFSLGFEQEFRFAENFMHYEHSDLGIKRKLVKGLSTSLRYRNVVEFDEGGSDMEHRPHWNLTAKVKLFKGLSLKNNVRVEYRIREQKDDDFRYRDKGTLTWKTGRVSSYVADEIFIDKGEFIRNRLYFGIDGKVNRSIKVGAFYLRRTQEKDDWEATHIFGLKIALTPQFGKRSSGMVKGAVARSSTRSENRRDGQQTAEAALVGQEPAGR